MGEKKKLEDLENKIKAISEISGVLGAKFDVKFVEDLLFSDKRAREEKAKDRSDKIGKILKDGKDD